MFKRPGGQRPFKVSAEIALEFDSPDSPYPPVVQYKFRNLLVGELVAP